MRERVERVFAGELNRSDLVLGEGGGGGRPRLLTPTGLSLGRLTIAGALTEMERNGDFVHARVADPTGAFSLLSGWHRPEVTTALARIEPPAFLAVTAFPRFPLRRGTGAALLPEAVAEVDRPARDTWVTATAESTLGRLERVSAVLAGGGDDPDIARAVSHYRVTPSLILELTDMIHEALATVLAGKGRRGEEAGGKATKELVVAFLSARPGEMFPLEDILAELGRQGIGPEDGTRAVKELLAEGECYMPKKGSFRLA